MATISGTSTSLTPEIRILHTTKVEIGLCAWTKLEVEIFDDTSDAVVLALAGIHVEHSLGVVTIELAGAIGLSELRRLEREFKVGRSLPQPRGRRHSSA